MAKNWLLGIDVEGFKSFRDRASLSFPESGLWLLSCRNLDTGGSSGGGKSNFFEAAASALGYGGAPATETQSWLTQAEQRVRLRFRSDAAGPWELSWGAKPSLSGGGQSPVTGARAAAEARRRLLGLPDETVGALAYRPQKEAGKILSLANADLQKFLAGLLPLEVFEAAVAESGKASAVLQGRVASAAAAADRAAALLRAAESPEIPAHTDTLPLAAMAVQAAEVVSACESEERRLAGAFRTFDDESLGIYSAVAVGPGLAVSAAMARLDEFHSSLPAAAEPDSGLARMREGARMAQVFLAAAQQRDDQARQAARLEQQRLRGAIDAAKAAISCGPAARVRERVLLAEVSVLRSGTCGTCQRPWVGAPAELARAEAELERQRATIAAADDAVGATEALSAQYDAVHSDPDPGVAEWGAELERVRGIVAELEAEERGARALAAGAWKAQEAALRAGVSEAELAVAAATAEASAQRTAARQVLEAAGRQAASALRQADLELQGRRAALAAAEAGNVSRASRLRALEERRTESRVTQAELAAAQAELAAELDFTSCFGREGFLGSIFDEILREISAEANGLLAAIPNTADVSLDFRSESKTEKGAVVRGIRPVITVGGHAAALRSGTSGGMRSAIDLAADAAVRRVVGRRTGCMPMWWFLDESFEGLEHVCKEAVMEMLSAVARDGFVLVVDHDERFKSMFAGTVVLERSGGGTRIATS